MSAKKRKKGGVLVYRIMAAVLALLLWFYVYQTQNPVSEQIFNIPLRTMQISPGLVMVDGGATIQIRAQGPKRIIENAQFKDISAYVNLYGLGAGSHNVRVYASLPDNLQQTSIEPSSLTVTLENIQNISLPVEVEYINALPEQSLKMLTPTLKPAEVVVYGASTYLNEISAAFVEIDLAALTSSANLSLPIRFKDEDGGEINRSFDSSPETIDIFLPLIGEQPDRLLPLNVPLTGKPAEGYQISGIVLQPSFAQIFGDMQTLLDLSAINTEAVDISGASASVSSSVGLVLPNNTSAAVSENISVIVNIEPVKEITVVKNSLYYYNLPPEYIIESEPPHIAVTVAGPESRISSLKEGEISLFADVAGLEEGEHTVVLQASLPANIRLIALQPEELTLVLKK
jgi:YbbR domain-containing protein